jgi:hypothetical protein
MEIFRYAVDIRIRYSKTKLQVNAPVTRAMGNLGVDELDVDNPDVDALDGRRRFKRTTKKVGDAERVLGYVGDDFSIADFLNLYTTR